MWGAWESAACAALFTVPALILLLPTAFDGIDGAPPRGFGAVDWVVVAAGIGGALALTLAARGIGTAMAFLSTGLVGSSAWLVAGRLALGGGPFVTVYAALALVCLAGHYNLLPVALLAARRRERSRTAEDAAPACAPACACPHADRSHADRRGTAWRLWGVVASAVALDLSPVVFFLAPDGVAWHAAFGWAIMCVACGGTLAAAVLGELGERNRGPGGGADGRGS